MKITQRQIGRIEAACFGLNTLTECAVGKTLINTIREVLDEVDSDSDLDGDLNDLEYFSTDSLEWPSVESIRQFAQEIRWEETGMIPAIRLILDHFNLTQAEFARLIGVSRRDLEYSLDWQDGRKELLSRMTELFGTDGGAIASNPVNGPAAAEVPQGRTDAPPPFSISKKCLEERIQTEPQAVIKEIKDMWTYTHNGTPIADSNPVLSVQQLIGAIQLLPLGHEMEHPTYSQLSRLLDEPPYVVAEAMSGNVSGLLKFRLAQVFGWKGEMK